MAIYFGKISNSDQVERSYSVSNLKFLNGLQVNDFVFPKERQQSKSYVSRLWRVDSINQNGDSYTVRYNIVCQFNRLPLKKFIGFNWFLLNKNLLNKVIRTTRGIGFIKIDLVGHTENELLSNFENVINNTNNFRKVVVVNDPTNFVISDDILLCKNNNTFDCYFDNKFSHQMSVDFDPQQYVILSSFIRDPKGPKGIMFKFLKFFPAKGTSSENLLGFYELFYGDGTSSVFNGIDEDEDDDDENENQDETNISDNSDSAVQPWPYQKIYYGAPGTGKSHLLDETKNNFICAGNFLRITFHQEFSFYDFFGTFKPCSNGSTICYKFVPGPFMELYVKAIKDPEHNYMLIIEEINRANAASTFGSVFQLLDRENGISRYPINIPQECKEYLLENGITDDKIFLRPNFYIWATMNSADQGVFTLDTAFKRRWSFEYIGIDSNEKVIDSLSFIINGFVIEWNKIRKAVNNFLLSLNINEDKLMGPFFINPAIFKHSNNSISLEFKYKVLMYLFEDVARNRRNEIFNVSPMILSEVFEVFENSGINVFKDTIVDEYKKL